MDYSVASKEDPDADLHIQWNPLYRRSKDRSGSGEDFGFDSPST